MGEIIPSESLSSVTYAGINSMHSQKTKQPYILSSRSSKRSKTTKKNSWVAKDLTKSPKKKYFEENGAVQNAVKNRTTKNWVEEELSKLSMKKKKKKKKKRKRKRKKEKKKKDIKKTVKMSRRCKAGLFF